MAIIVGICIGLVLGLTGAGGSVFAVPLLMILLDLPVQQAMGISLGVVATSTLFGGISKIKSGQIHWPNAIIYAVIGSCFAPIGVWANHQIDENLILLGFACLVIIIATSLWFQSTKHSNSINTVENQIGTKPKDFNYSIGVISGAMLTGLLSGLFGVGGGFVIVPVLIFLAKMNIKEAVATSLIIISVISGSGFISFLLSGSEINIGILSLMASGGIIGMSLGMMIGKNIPEVLLQRTFSILMLLMAITTLTIQLS